MNIIAEVGSVHDGSLGNALKLVELGKNCGADTVKFQTHLADAETLRNAPAPKFFDAEGRYDYFKRTEFSFEEWDQIKEKCDECEIEFLSSPFSIETIDLLERLGVKRYKIASGEVTNIPLLEYTGATKKPVLLSSGMSTWEELDIAVDSLMKFHSQITVLQCTSEYPCDNTKIGLNIMEEMKERYGLPVGLSDHCMNNYSAFSAVALGASVVEKHLTFSREMYGSDAVHSLEPKEFKELVEGINTIRQIITTPVDKNELAMSLSDMRKVYQKSIVSVVDIHKGEIITGNMLGIKKPGTGIPPSMINSVLQRRARKNIAEGNLINMDDLEDA